MSLEKHEHKIPSVIIGEDKNISIKLTDESTHDPFDLTAAGEIEAIFLKNDNLSYLSKKLSTSGIVMISAIGGHFQIVLSSVDSASLAPSVSPKLSDIKLKITIAGKLTIVPLLNSINIIIPPFPGA